MIQIIQFKTAYLGNGQLKDKDGIYIKDSNTFEKDYILDITTKDKSLIQDTKFRNTTAWLAVTDHKIDEENPVLKSDKIIIDNNNLYYKKHEIYTVDGKVANIVEGVLLNIIKDIKYGNLQLSIQLDNKDVILMSFSPKKITRQLVAVLEKAEFGVDRIKFENSYSNKFVSEGNFKIDKFTHQPILLGKEKEVEDYMETIPEKSYVLKDDNGEESEDLRGDYKNINVYKDATGKPTLDLVSDAKQQKFFIKAINNVIKKPMNYVTSKTTDAGITYIFFDKGAYYKDFGTEQIAPVKVPQEEQALPPIDTLPPIDMSALNVEMPF